MDDHGKGKGSRGVPPAPPVLLQDRDEKHPKGHPGAQGKKEREEGNPDDYPAVVKFLWWCVHEFCNLTLLATGFPYNVIPKKEAVS